MFCIGLFLVVLQLIVDVLKYNIFVNIFSKIF